MKEMGIKKYLKSDKGGGLADVLFKSFKEF